MLETLASESLPRTSIAGSIRIDPEGAWKQEARSPGSDSVRTDGRQV